MQNGMPTIGGGNGKKSWFKNPQNWVGLALLAGIAMLGITVVGPFAITALALLKTLLGELIATIAVGSVALGLVALLANKQFRTVVRMAFNGLTRKLTGLIVELDPIAIMKSYAEDLTERFNSIATSIAQLRGQKTKLETQINENNDQIEQCMRMMQQAQRANNEAAMRKSGNQAKRLSDLNEKTLKPLLVQMTAHLTLMTKFSEATEVVREDLLNEVQSHIQRRNMIESSYAVMQDSKRIMGESEEFAAYNLAVEISKDDYFAKIGEIDQFIESSRGFMAEFDLQKEANYEAALEQLNQWSSRVDNLMGKPTEVKQLDVPKSEFETLMRELQTSKVTVPVTR